MIMPWPPALPEVDPAMVFNTNTEHAPQNYDEIEAVLDALQTASPGSPLHELQKRCADRLRDMRKSRERIEAEEDYRRLYSWRSIPGHDPDPTRCRYLKEPQGCYYCCHACDTHTHRCHFCGTDLDHHSYEYDARKLTRTRHWLSDCRPDLVKHEPGPLCTWSYDTESDHNCYAYQDRDRNWTDQHIHFHKDGPMA